MIMLLGMVNLGHGWVLRTLGIYTVKQTNYNLMHDTTS